jgi:hypothetical protein
MRMVRTRTRAAVAAGVAGSLMAALAPAAPAGADSVTGTVKMIIQASKFNPAAPSPSGIAWMPSPTGSGGNLVMVDSEVDEMGIYKGSNMWMFSTGGPVSQTGVTTRYSREPTGVAYDPVTRTMYVSDDDKRTITSFTAGSDGKFGTSDDPTSSYSASDAGDSDPEGVAVDSTTGDLYLAGGVTKAFSRVQQGADRKLGTSDDVEQKFDVSKYGLRDMEGVAYDEARQRVVAFCHSSKRLYELDRSGTLLRIVDISATSPKGGGDVTIGPASSGGGTSYWIAMRGVDNDRDPNENDGKIYEVSVPGFTPPPPANDTPVVTIDPGPPAQVPSGTTLTLTGRATDTEDGTKSSALTWRSNLVASPLGTGATVDVALGDGLHQITASYTDTGGEDRLGLRDGPGWGGPARAGHGRLPGRGREPAVGGAVDQRRRRRHPAGRPQVREPLPAAVRRHGGLGPDRERRPDPAHLLELLGQGRRLPAHDDRHVDRIGPRRRDVEQHAGLRCGRGPARLAGIGLEWQDVRRGPPGRVRHGRRQLLPDRDLDLERRGRLPELREGRHRAAAADRHRHALRPARRAPGSTAVR